MKVTRWILTGGFAMLALFACAYLNAQTKPAESTHFVNADRTIEVDYPSRWQIMTMQQKAVVLALQPDPKSKDPTFTLSIPPIPAHKPNVEIKLVDVERGFIDALRKTIPDAKIVETTEEKFAGDPARRSVVMGHVGPNQVEIKSVTLFCVHGEKVYALSLSGTTAQVDLYLNEFNGVARSGRFPE